jgi:hypothetical protein
MSETATMPKVVLILGEADGGFCYYPPLCDGSPPEWFICLTEDQEDELRGVLREWRHRGTPVILRLTWAPGDPNFRCTVLPACTGKPYRLLQPDPNEWHVAVAPFELPFNLKGYLDWLMSEDLDEEHALFEEATQRFKCGDLSLKNFEQFVSVVEEIHQENIETIGHMEKILRRGKFRVVPAQTP